MEIGLDGMHFGWLGYLWEDWVGMDLGVVLEGVGFLGDLRCGGFVGSFGLEKGSGALLALFRVGLTACGHVGLWLSQHAKTYLLPPLSPLTFPKPFLTSHYLCFVLSPPRVAFVRSHLLYFLRIWVLTCLGKAPMIECLPLVLYYLAPMVFHTLVVFRIYQVVIGHYLFSAMVRSS